MPCQRHFGAEGTLRLYQALQSPLNPSCVWSAAALKCVCVCVRFCAGPCVCVCACAEESGSGSEGKACTAYQNLINNLQWEPGQTHTHARAHTLKKGQTGVADNRVTTFSLSLTHAHAHTLELRYAHSLFKHGQWTNRMHEGQAQIQSLI